VRHGGALPRPVLNSPRRSQFLGIEPVIDILLNLVLVEIITLLYFALELIPTPAILSKSSSVRSPHFSLIFPFNASNFLRPGSSPYTLRRKML
jgi:hypothetical protein